MRPAQRSIRASLFLLPVLLYPALASAQPLGNERELIHVKVEAFQKRIATLSQQISNDPRNAQLYDARGSLYVELYRTLYDGNYLSHFYGKKPPELTVVVIASKAIADFNQAIQKAPSADLYGKRGEMHEVRWSEVAWALSTNVQLKTDWPYESWEFLGQRPTDERQLDVLDRFLTNTDFAAAVKDYNEALRLNRDPDAAKELHTRFARLYSFRTERIPLELPAIRKMVNEPNRYHYSLWADFDRAIEHMSKGNRAPSECAPWYGPTETFVCQVYISKGRRAFDYGKYHLALQSFNAAEKYIPKKEAYFLCEFYLARARLHAKMGNLDAAINDANRTSTEMPCGGREPYELRGDAYFAKGSWQAAIAEYTSVLKDCTSGCSPGAHKHRALSYLQLGETDKAIDDLIDDQKRCSECTRADILLRSRIFRRFGQEKLALADERTAQLMLDEIKWKKGTKLVFGELKLPVGIALNTRKLSAQLIDAADPSKHWWTSLDSLSRFSLRYWKGRPFRIFGYYDGEKDGKLVRFFGRTGILTIRNESIGPITITLNRIARK